MSHAIVTLTVQVKTTDSWGPGCTISQINDQAIESAVGALTNLFRSQQATGKFAIVGKPKVTIVTMDVDKQ